MAILVLGGVKSGKSRYAAWRAGQMAATGREVVLVATAEAHDDEMAERIARHKTERPADWRTVECGAGLTDVLPALDSERAVVIVDCLTLWLTALLTAGRDDAFIRNACDRLVRQVGAFRAPLVLVSNETNLGVIPPDRLSRRFCDLAGVLHQKLGNVCDEVVLVAAGLPLHLKGAMP